MKLRYEGQIGQKCRMITTAKCKVQKRTCYKIRATIVQIIETFPQYNITLNLKLTPSSPSSQTGMYCLSILITNIILNAMKEEEDE